MDIEVDYNISKTDAYWREDAYSVYNWNELLPILFVYGVTFILGLAGNCLIIFTTFKYRRMQSVTNIFLASLAASDLMLIIICIPIKVAKIFSYTWDMGFFVCKFVHYLQNVSAVCSVLTLTAISIERYYAIVHPVKAKYICTIRQAKRIILTIWVISLLLAVPTLIVQVHLPVGVSNKYFYCVKNWDWHFIWRFHEVYMLLIILIGPFCIMAFSYTVICWEVWKVMERRSIMTSKQVLSRNYQIEDDTYTETFILTEVKKLKEPSLRRDDNHMVKQVIYMLVAVVTLFAICWAPVLIDSVLTAYHILPHLRKGFLKHMSIAFNLMAYFNSCINPIIYGFMSKSFRESFLLVLCCSSHRVMRGNSHHTYNLRYISRTGFHTKNTSI